MLLLVGCASVAGRVSPATLSVDAIAGCLEAHRPGPAPVSWHLPVGGGVSDRDQAPVRCLQGVINASGLEAKRGVERQYVDVAWTPAGGDAGPGSRALKSGGQFTVERAWFTLPRKLSGPTHTFGAGGDTGFAIVRCVLPISGRPEQCRAVKAVRGQDAVSPIEASTYTPCLKDGVPFECDYVQQVIFRLPSE